jgi:hypothetical protein
MGAVALLTTYSVQTHASNLRMTAENERLEKFIETVASEATELMALVKSTNSSFVVRLHTPTLIGTKRYWIRLTSEESKVWIEGALGSPRIEIPDLRVFLPLNASTSGTYQSENGTLLLNCSIQDSTLQLTLGRG